MMQHLHATSALLRLLGAVVPLAGGALGKASPGAGVPDVGERTCSWPLPGMLSLAPLLPTCPPPMDDHVGPVKSDWTPWSYRPFCLYPDEKKDKYCLYSLDTFRNGRGLSVIATPSTAASLVPALDDSVVRPELRDHPSSRMGSQNRSDLAYEIRQLRGRGLGVVATRPIKQWELIMTDFPSLIAEMDLLEVMGEEKRQRMLRRALQHLGEEERAGFMGLARVFGGDATEDILRTNILAVDLNGKMHMGLFTQASVSPAWPISTCRACEFTLDL